MAGGSSKPRVRTAILTLQVDKARKGSRNMIVRNPGTSDFSHRHPAAECQEIYPLPGTNCRSHPLAPGASERLYNSYTLNTWLLF